MNSGTQAIDGNRAQRLQARIDEAAHQHRIAGDGAEQGAGDDADAEAGRRRAPGSPRRGAAIRRSWRVRRRSRKSPMAAAPDGRSTSRRAPPVPSRPPEPAANQPERRAAQARQTLWPCGFGCAAGSIAALMRTRDITSPQKASRSVPDAVHAPRQRHAPAIRDASSEADPGSQRRIDARCARDDESSSSARRTVDRSDHRRVFLHVDVGLDHAGLLKRDAGRQDRVTLRRADLAVGELGALLELLVDDGLRQLGDGDEVASSPRRNSPANICAPPRRRRARASPDRDDP